MKNTTSIIQSGNNSTVSAGRDCIINGKTVNTGGTGVICTGGKLIINGKEVKRRGIGNSITQIDNKVWINGYKYNSTTNKLEFSVAGVLGNIFDFDFFDLEDLMPVFALLIFLIVAVVGYKAYNIIDECQENGCNISINENKQGVEDVK